MVSRNSQALERTQSALSDSDDEVGLVSAQKFVMNDSSVLRSDLNQGKFIVELRSESDGFVIARSREFKISSLLKEKPEPF